MKQKKECEKASPNGAKMVRRRDEKKDGILEKGKESIYITAEDWGGG